jgi:hypothetical protein
MQRLWARLLAREVDAPGSYSLHSVDFLSKMSPEDATIFAKVAPFVTNGGILRDALKDDQGEERVEFGTLLYLDDLGLVNGTSTIGGHTYNMGVVEREGSKYSTLLAHDVGLVIDLPPDWDPTTRKLHFSNYVVTRVGREILTLAKFDPDVAYLRRVAKLAIGQGATKVRIGRRVGNRLFDVKDFELPPEVQ